MVLTDVVLTRERLGRRPLEIEGQVDPLWRKPTTDPNQVWFGHWITIFWAIIVMQISINIIHL